jgi:hypothetical protein
MLLILCPGILQVIASKQEGNLGKQLLISLIGAHTQLLMLWLA